MIYIKYIKNIYFIYTNRCFLAVFIYTVYIKYIQKEGVIQHLLTRLYMVINSNHVSNFLYNNFRFFKRSG